MSTMMRGRGGDSREGSTRLVGREEELVELGQNIDDVVAGSFRIVVVAGEAGVGKTRLVAEVVRGYANRMTCLSARAYRLGGATSLELWAEALDRHLRDLPEEELHRLVGGSSADLGVLVGAVAPLAPLPAHEIRRGRLFDGLVELFDRLATARPVLVALDDVHLADASSWEALRWMARRLPRSPIGVVVTARPTELAQHPVAVEVLMGLAEEGMLNRLALGPLERDEVSELVRDVLRRDPARSRSLVPDRLIDWLMERSLGYPLFVVGLLQALLDEQADLASPRLDRLPESLRERVVVELAALDPEQRDVLELLAVVERRMSLEGLAATSGRLIDELAATLDGLCATGVVVAHQSGGDLRYEIAHPVVQDAVYETIGGARRRGLHRSVAQTLQATGRLGAAAAHVARSAGRGDAEAVDLLRRAMRQAEQRGLFREALAALAALLEVLPADDERWLQVLVAMDRHADWVIGHLAESDADTAVAVMERIRPVAERSASVAAQGTVDLHLASFLSIGAGRLDDAERACRRAIRRFGEAGDDESVLLARQELAWILGCSGDLHGQVELAEAVAKEATSAGYRRPAVYAVGTGGYALARLGRFEEAERALHRSIELAETADDTYRMAWGRNHLGVLQGLTGRPDEGLQTVHQALQDDPNAAEAATLEYLAHAEWLRGDLGSCVEWIERSESRRSMRGSRRRAWGLGIAARAYADLGQHGRALRRSEQARATYGGREILDWTCWSDAAEATLAWHNGEHRRAMAALGRACDWLASMQAKTYEALFLVDVAEISADGGDSAGAQDAADRVREIADDVGGGLHPHLADLTAAWSNLADGRSSDAAAAAQRAAAALSAAGYTLWATSAHEAAGRALTALDRDEAIAVLGDAASSYDACGAAWRRDRTLVVLNRLGNRGRRATTRVQGPQALTAREHEIAVHATEGYTARETASRLYISQRTVETHLQNVYAKLGVASKRELIQRAADLGLSGDGTAPA